MGLLGSTAREGLRRIAEDAYSGKTYVTILCNTNGDTSYTAESSISDWETIEVSGNGYSRSNYLLQDVGSPSLTDGTCLAAEIPADFSATGGSYTYDSLVIFEQSALYPVSVSTISPAKSLGDGESVSYRVDIKLSQVDFPLQIEAPEDPFFGQTRVYITFEEGGEGSSFASGATDSGFYRLDLGSFQLLSGSLISRKRSKFGAHSLESFTDSGGVKGGLYIQQLVSLNLDNLDFTIEAHIFLAGAFSSSRATIAHGPGGSWIFYVGKDSDFATTENPNGFVLNANMVTDTGSPKFVYPITSVGALVPEKRWCHVAFVRAETRFILFVDGVIASEETFDDFFSIQTSVAELVLGASEDSVSRNFNGYIDNFRMTIGTARYEDNFEPPELPSYSGIL